MRAREIVRSISEDTVSDTVTYHDELNPQVWQDGELDPEVRQRLLAIAKLFTGYLNVPNFEIDDIVLTGSMCNFNYTKYSDFDVHVVTDYSRLECDDIAEEFYRAKKELWNDRHDITIHGHEVELYVEDAADPPVSGGVYSLKDDKWIRKPSYDPPKVDDQAVRAKVDDLIREIRTAMSPEATDDDIARLRTKIRNMRQSGLAKHGEFGTENLAFKVLRNQGLLDLLSQHQIRHQDQEMSINETLKKVKGRWALVSKTTGRPLQYYHGSGHPSREWVRKVERRVHSFGEGQELDELKIDNKHGLGQVPLNQSIDYHGLRVKMKPSTFLKLSLPLNPNNPNEKKRIDYIAQHLDSPGIGAPFLDVRIPSEWEDGELDKPALITGHEGRHRMYAILKAEGDAPVEVHLIPTGGLRRRHLKPDWIERLNANIIGQRGNQIDGPIFEVL